MAGVDCARRRRPHQRGGWSDSALAFTRTGHPLSAWTKLDFHLKTKIEVKHRYWFKPVKDQKLGEVAREAKERLAERLR
ncbi:hypothetical protein V6N13_047599 [Hibiscus sabdariffa]|uniref:Uncharacterized protein n=1 Tax=Hibiscus sabdariffa TaxID=183260 RepID=A0ABR2F4M5_9ROSI